MRVTWYYLTTHNMGDTHMMIIYYRSEMVRWEVVGLHQYGICGLRGRRVAVLAKYHVNARIRIHHCRSVLKEPKHIRLECRCRVVDGVTDFDSNH
jgi:hypothetical protein